MKLKKSILALFMALGLTWIGLVSMPSQALSDPADGVGVSKHTEPYTDGTGKVVGTITKTQRGATSTEIFTITSGPEAGRILTITKDSKGTEIARNDKFAGGGGFTSKLDAEGVRTEIYVEKDGETLTRKKNEADGKVIFSSVSKPNGEAESFTYNASGKLVTSSYSHPDGRVETITYGADGKPALLTAKDKNGNFTTALPDGKGGFTSVVKGEQGRVTNTTYDAKGQPTSATVKDKNGKVVSTTVYDKSGKVVAQTGKKQTLTAESGDTSGSEKKTISGSVPGSDKPEALKAVIPDNQGLSREKIKSSGADWGSSKASEGSGLSREKILKQNTDWGSKASTGSGLSQEKILKQNTDFGSPKSSTGSNLSPTKIMKQKR